MSDIQKIIGYFQRLQVQLIEALTETSGDSFSKQTWQSHLGQGCTYHLSEGQVLERAGVNFSSVSGLRLPGAASRRHQQWADQPYQATGVSLVIHPKNPYCPTVHLNVRYFTAANQWWFGGGMDLTPYYGFVEDCRHFHQTCRQALDSLDVALYPKFKQACDQYFYLPHRQEARGIGGVFFDDFNQSGFDYAFDVTKAVAEAFLPAYQPILQRRKDRVFEQKHQHWQQYRRGRYVEFNLVWDRGTLFGLQSKGRADMILMSLPPKVRFGEPNFAWGDEENALIRDFLSPRDWV